MNASCFCCRACRSSACRTAGNHDTSCQYCHSLNEEASAKTCTVQLLHAVYDIMRVCSRCHEHHPPIPVVAAQALTEWREAAADGPRLWQPAAPSAAARAEPGLPAASQPVDSAVSCPCKQVQYGISASRATTVHALLWYMRYRMHSTTSGWQPAAVKVHDLQPHMSS
jgi:hypothetical protein